MNTPDHKPPEQWAMEEARKLGAKYFASPDEVDTDGMDLFEGLALRQSVKVRNLEFILDTARLIEQVRRDALHEAAVAGSRAAWLHFHSKSDGHEVGMHKRSLHKKF